MVGRRADAHADAPRAAGERIVDQDVHRLLDRVDAREPAFRRAGEQTYIGLLVLPGGVAACAAAVRPAFRDDRLAWRGGMLISVGMAVPSLLLEVGFPAIAAKAAMLVSGGRPPLAA